MKFTIICHLAAFLISDYIYINKGGQMTNELLIFLKCRSLHVFTSRYDSTLLGCTFYTKGVTGFGKTDHIVTIDISRKTDLKY